MVKRKTSEKYEIIAIDMLNGINLNTIAKKYNVSTRTLLRLRQKEDFKQVLIKHKKECFEQALNRATYLSKIAIDELKNIITSDDTNAQSKIQACKIVLELAKNNYEYENIEERINKLERSIKDV